MGFLILSTAATGAAITTGDTRTTDAELAGAWASEVARIVGQVGHPVIWLREPGASHCRRRARELAQDGGEPTVHLVATVGRPRVVSAQSSIQGRRAAEEIAKALGEVPSVADPVGPGLEDYRYLRGPGGDLDNLAAVLVSPVELELMAEAAEVELGQAIAAAVLELLGKPKKAKKSPKKSGPPSPPNPPRD
tara:strand:- start:3356 stop:3931 length:576 start_codon:yes stop_codon:yes gene_type:complete